MDEPSESVSLERGEEAVLLQWRIFMPKNASDYYLDWQVHIGHSRSPEGAMHIDAFRISLCDKMEGAEGGRQHRHQDPRSETEWHANRAQRDSAVTTWRRRMLGAGGSTGLEAAGMDPDRGSEETRTEHDLLKCSFMCALRDGESREPRHPWSQWYFQISLYHWNLKSYAVELSHGGVIRKDSKDAALVASTVMEPVAYSRAEVNISFPNPECAEHEEQSHAHDGAVCKEVASGGECNAESQTSRVDRGEGGAVDGQEEVGAGAGVLRNDGVWEEASSARAHAVDSLPTCWLKDKSVAEQSASCLWLHALVQPGAELYYTWEEFMLAAETFPPPKDGHDEMRGAGLQSRGIF